MMPEASACVRVHAILHGSTANGPGLRSVVWLQGCALRCSGCFNPETHDPSAGRVVLASELARELAEAPTEGLTLSGGEPTDQAAAVVRLLRAYRARCERTVVLYSGRSLEEVTALACGPDLLALVDAAILGPYVRGHELQTGRWAGCRKHLHILTARLSPSDFAVPETEILIHSDGTCTITGYPDMAFVADLR